MRLVSLMWLCLAACSAQPATPPEPTIFMPNPDSFGSRDRNYGLVENEDGTIRVYAAQRGDDTDLMMVRRTTAGWSDPIRVQAPRRETNTTPYFSRLDGRLYYSSDAPHPERPGRRDRNIWSGGLGENGELSDVRPMPDAINTGAHEESPSFTDEGVFFFSSDHTRGIGGFDIYRAEETTAGWHVELVPFNTQMADTHAYATADGQSVFFYAHLPDVIGIVDIFRADRTDDGWSDAVNLGETINSALIDYAPAFSHDGETFFFSRQGQMMEIEASAAFAAKPGSSETP